MEKNDKLPIEQIIAFSFLGIIGNVVYIHTWIDHDTDRSSWLAAFLGILLLIPFALWILYLGKRHPQYNIFDILYNRLGKIPTGIICILFIFINVAVAVTQLNMFTQMVHVFLLRSTPSWVIMFLMVSMCTWIVQKGTIKMGRLITVLTIIGLINYLGCFVFAFPSDVSVKSIIPIFDTTLIGFIKGTIFITCASSEYLLIFMVIVRHINKCPKYDKWVVGGIVITAIIFSIAILIIIAMMSPELAKRIAFGGVNAARIIHIGEFLQGLELLVFITYQFIATGKTIMSLYCSWDSAKIVFANKKPNLQLMILAFLIIVPSIWLNSYNVAYYLAVFMSKFIILPFVILVLLLTTVSSRIKRK